MSEKIKFTVECEMSLRWAKQFCGMLRTMQGLGSMGSSRSIVFYADGDGDFRPKFHINNEELNSLEWGREESTMHIRKALYFDADLDVDNSNSSDESLNKDKE